MKIDLSEIKQVVCISLIFSILFTSTSLFAQSLKRDGAKIIGYVKDADGNAVPSATVYVLNTRYSTQVDKDGHYVLMVASGEYEVMSSAVGFIAEKKKVSISRNENKYYQFVLKVDPNTAIEQVVVSGKSAIQEVRETPYNVAVLDATKFHNSSMELSDLLNRASGVKIRQSGGLGSATSVNLNGFSGRHVKVFIDGVPMQGMGSAFQLNNIPVNLAERIEIYKGVGPHPVQRLQHQSGRR